MLFADDAAPMNHTEEVLQRLADHLTDACKQFRLTIGLIKINISAQDVSTSPYSRINNVIRDVVDKFTYLGSL